MTNATFHVLLEHNAWATAVLIDDAARLTAAQFCLRFDIGPGSLHDTLRHIVGAMWRWADRIGAQPLRPSIEDDPETLPPDALRRLLAGATEELRGVVARVEATQRWEEWMAFPVPEGPTYRFTRRAALLHVLTHGMHHRAQALNIRRRLGLPPLGLDLDVVEWECVRTGQISVPPDTAER